MRAAASLACWRPRCRAPPLARALTAPAPQTACDVSVAMQHDFDQQEGASGLKVNFDIRELNLLVRM
jgi:hypothetical protein